MDPLGQNWYDLCATFSVKDHTVPGAFVAEVLLYDRLVIPVPPQKGDFTTNGDVTQKQAEEEWRRWQDARWEPERQTQLVGILRNKLGDDRIIAVPWTTDLQGEWRKNMEGAADDTAETVHSSFESLLNQYRQDGYIMTGSLLARYAPAMSKTIVAVSTFRSLEDLQKHTGVRRGPPQQFAPQSLMAVIGFELFVPHNPREADANDFQLLSEAATVAADDRYRERRTALYLWQQRFIRNGFTDAPSIKQALAEMQTLVSDLNYPSNWNGVKVAYSFFKCFPIGGIAEKAEKVCIDLRNFFRDEPLGKLPPDPFAIPAAGLVLDAQHRLRL